jgi:hypothetical protein
VNTRAPAAHPRSAPADAPTVEARATSGAVRRIDIHWHAEGEHGAEKATITVYRRNDGVPMIDVVTSDGSPVVVSYDGAIDGVEEVE